MADLCFAYADEERASRFRHALERAGMSAEFLPLASQSQSCAELRVLHGPTVKVLAALAEFSPDRVDSPAVFALLESSQAEDRIAALLRGAADAFDDRDSEEELLVRIARALEARKKVCWLLEENHRLDRLSSTDALTELPNRRQFQERLVQEYRRAQRYEAPLSLVLLDLDHFKQVNDRFGHPAGDAVLQAVAGCLRRSTRETDLTARVGGEEFALILPQTHLAGSLTVAERIRKDLAQLAIGDLAIRVTASCGVSGLPGLLFAGPEDLFRSADEALYRAKREGRNRTCLFPGSSPTVPANVA